MRIRKGQTIVKLQDPIGEIISCSWAMVVESLLKSRHRLMLLPAEELAKLRERAAARREDIVGYPTHCALRDQVIEIWPAPARGGELLITFYPAAKTL